MPSLRMTKGSPVKVKAAVRRRKALLLRLKHNSYHAIAEKLGCSYGTAYNDVMKELDKLAAETREDTIRLRTLALRQLDRLASKLERKIEAGDVAAIREARRIEERRAKLLGTDAPEKMEIDGGVTTQLYIPDSPRFHKKQE